MLEADPQSGLAPSMLKQYEIRTETVVEKPADVSEL